MGRPGENHGEIHGEKMRITAISASQIVLYKAQRKGGI
jgi:hypothetical protein